MEINNALIVGVAGAGAMGAGIAQVAATAGHKVIVYDSFDNALEKAAAKLKADLKKLEEKGKLTFEKSTLILSRITFTNTLSDFKNCNVFIEAVIEDLLVKQKLFTQVEEIVSQNCVLATNTSSLPVIAIGSNCKKQDRIIGLHFFNPPTLMQLVEIIPTFNTVPSLVEEMKTLMRQWEKIAVVAKDTPGFIVNRIARPYYGEAIRIYEEGIADFSTIDSAMKTIGGFRMGPFELMDFIGNDVNYLVTKTVFEQMFYDPRYKPSITQRRLFEGKLFGRKSGKGYYQYQNAEIKDLPKPSSEKANEIFERIICMLINEAAEALYLNIASANDIELAMTKGVNYPKGLLHWADEIGIDKVLTKLTALQQWYGEDRYRPSPLLKEMSQKVNNFF